MKRFVEIVKEVLLFPFYVCLLGLAALWELYDTVRDLRAFEKQKIKPQRSVQ